MTYFTPSDTRDSGYIETEYFGVCFPHRSSYVDLICITQRWLCDLLWDHIAEVLRSRRAGISPGPDPGRACIVHEPVTAC